MAIAKENEEKHSTVSGLNKSINYSSYFIWIFNK